jgi:hypothetical protein
MVLCLKTWESMLLPDLINRLFLFKMISVDKLLVIYVLESARSAATLTVLR